MTKASSYRETFRQNRRLLILPMVLGVLVGGWFVLGAQKSYLSTASLWVDNPASTNSALGNPDPTLVPPAQLEQGLVTELLSTRGFVLSVAHQSRLGSYVATNASGGWGPTALLKLGGGGSLNDRIFAALSSKQVSTTIAGPQVLTIAYKGPTPVVAQSTLNGLVGALQQETGQLGQDHNQAALSYYRSQVQQANQALLAARQQADAYLRQHPGASPADPNFSALTTAETAASTNLSQAKASLNTAASSVNGGSVVRVIDPANLPLGPVSGKKKILLGIFGGLFAGALISFLGTLALTRGKSDPWEDELANGRALGGRHLTPAGASGGPSNGNGHAIEPANPRLFAGRRRVVHSVHPDEGA